MNNEFWKDVENYEDLYEVSDAGRVRNKVSGKILKPFSDGRKGYLKVDLYKDGIRKTYRIHRLVAEAFIPNPLNLSQVNHIDENKINNNVDNLEWCDCQYNIDYSKAKSVNQFSLDGRLLNTYKSTMEASRQTGISQGNISECCRDKRGQAGNFIWKYHI